MSSATKRWLLDVGERTARTFVQGFLGSVTLDAFTAFDPTWLENIGIGLAAGAYSVLMSFAFKGVGAPDSASALPENLDPPQP